MLNEGPHILVRRRVNQFSGCADLKDSAVFHYPDPVAQTKGFMEVVRDQDHRFVQPVFEIQELFLQFDLGEGIQSPKRFIEQDNGGIARQGARDRDPLPLASR